MFNLLYDFRFFTLIPHNFGVNNPPLLDNIELIKNKTEMLDNLLEIEIAYSLLKTGTYKKIHTSPKGWILWLKQT